MAVPVRRYDVGSMSSWERTPQGGLRIPSRPTRVGVFPYVTADGTTRREYRPPEEVFAPDSLATLKHAPVTDLHPEEDGVRIPVDPANFRDLAVGHVAEDVRQDGSHVGATLLVQDARMIRLIEAGERQELSCGYACILDPTSGVTQDGQPYDAIQREIVYNHAALGPQGWGRQGSTVGLKYDSGDAIQTPETPVEKETIDGKEYTIGTPEWVAAVRAHRAKLQTDLATANGRADALEKKTKETPAPAVDPKVFSAAVSRRVKLVADCARIAKKAGVKFDAEAAAESGDEGSMIAEAIKLLDPKFDPAGKDPAYLMGYFNALINAMGGAETEADDTTATETPGAMNDGQAPTTTALPQKPGEAKQDGGAKRSIFTARTDGGGGGGTVPTGRQDDGEDAADKARQAMIEKANGAWKNPLAANKPKG